LGTDFGDFEKDLVSETLDSSEVDRSDSVGRNKRVPDDKLIEIAREVLDGEVIPERSFIDTIPYKIPTDGDGHVKNMPSTMLERLKSNGFRLEYESRILKDGRRALKFNVVDMEDEEIEEFRNKKKKWSSNNRRVVSIVDYDIRRVYCDECGSLMRFGMIKRGDEYVPVVYCGCDRSNFVVLEDFDVSDYDEEFIECVKG